ncbi:MAG TPA: nuclear transport factor 2 family protein [Steroidobacteraceae bacterium]|nr:nuclear transport factor 2 family protein [Steroidobacteraceae bacterium]
MSDRSQSAALDEVISKHQIEETLHRWTRGADRIDLSVMQSAFHPQANINYGYSNGPVEEFLPWVVKFHTEDLVTTSHQIFNLLIELDGDTARSEAGVDCRLRYRGKKGLSDLLVLARYLDRWERRAGLWKIVDRVSVVDSYKTVAVEQDPEVDPWVKEVTQGRTDQSDLSYQYIKRRS